MVDPPPSVHVPVLLEEAIEWLRPVPGAILVDATLGGGGHTRPLAEQVVPGGRMIALDRDPSAVQRLAAHCGTLPVEAVQADFRDLPTVLQSRQVESVAGILLDLGLSSDQLEDVSRGFSFTKGGELDLRYDPARGEPAWQLVARLDAPTLAKLIYDYGEERFSRRIARQIVESRRKEPIRTAQQLATIVRRCVPRAKHHRIDPATRTFQALRIAVNDELGGLEQLLRDAPDCLASGGRIAIISFHSLEDRLVKHAFRQDPRLLVLTKKPIRPNEAEISRNPRSRSARFRVAERIVG